jgi:hypothetical protein
MSGGRHRRSDDSDRNSSLTGSTPGATARNGTAPHGAARNGAARAGAVRSATGQTGAVRTATGQTGAVRATNGQTGAVRTTNGQTGGARSATGQTRAVRTATGQTSGVRSATGQTTAVRNGAPRGATGQTGAVRAARPANGQTGATRLGTGQTSAVRNGAARPAAGQTGATQTATAQTATAQPNAVETATAEPTAAQPTRAFPTAAALNAAARAARARAARGGTTETQAPPTSIPAPRHPATGEVMAPEDLLLDDEPLTMPFGIEAVRVPPAEDLVPTEADPGTARPAAPAEDPEPEPAAVPAPAATRTRHALPDTIAALSWPRRLMIALVVLALLGAAVWMAAVRPTSQVPAPVPLPATPEPVAPPSAGPTPPSTLPSTAPTPPPTGPVSLTGWKLTIPEASDKGTAASVNPAASKSPWLTRGDGGSIKFWAPVDGATTPNSQHPRTELDSLTNFKAGTSPHTLNATLVVSQAPSANQDIIIGQIHGADDISSVPFVMLHYDAGTIKVVVKEAQSGSTSDKYPLITGVPLGARFSYTISDLGNGSMTFSANYGTSTRSITAAIPQPFRGATVRFQAGAYQQGESSSGATDGARLTFYTLRTTPGS